MPRDVSRLRQRISYLKIARDRLENRLMRPRPMRVGSVIRRPAFCRKKGCRKCTEGVGHGPYYYLSWKEKGKTRLVYLEGARARVIELGRNYQGFQRGIARLGKIHKEIIELLWEIAEEKIERGPL